MTFGEIAVALRNEYEPNHAHYDALDAQRPKRSAAVKDLEKRLNTQRAAAALFGQQAT